MILIHASSNLLRGATDYLIMMMMMFKVLNFYHKPYLNLSGAKVPSLIISSH